MVYGGIKGGSLRGVIGGLNDGGGEKIMGRDIFSYD